MAIMKDAVAKAQQSALSMAKNQSDAAAQRERESGEAIQRDWTAKARQARVQESKDYAKQLRDQAGGYAANIGKTQEALYNPQADALRRQLANQLSDVRAGASSRGLLYSGLRQSGEQQAAAGTAAQMAATRKQINDETQAQADLYDKLARESELDVQRAELGEYGGQQERAMGDFNLALQRRLEEQDRRIGASKERSQALGQLGQGLGTIGGMGLAAYQEKNKKG